MRTQLDKEKLDRLLKLNKKKYVDLAKDLGWTRQLLNYHLSKRTLTLADAAASIFGLKGKDLMK